MSPKIDLAKRRRIMQRSQKLGHCVCDPKRPCPCEAFTRQGICLCAGERPDHSGSAQVKLTELVSNAGCASKIAPADLEAVLQRLPPVRDRNVISGIPAGDDAGVYRLSDGVTLVQTVDVFTPCVDDPETFGRICAANCLSDIYAMGGRPRTALSILAFPAETLDGQIMYQMLAGAMQVLDEAGVALIGGHSIKDQEIKLGFAITGTIDADSAIHHGTAKTGDLLVLTKPLGVGVMSFCRQIGRTEGLDFAAAERSMAALNKPAAEAMTQTGVSAATDITGFGLFGHMISMLRHSGVTAQVYADALPAFGGVLQALRDGVVPGAIERNGEYVGADLSVADGVEEAMVHLGLDAQTSGGLLIAVPAERLKELTAALAGRGVSGCVIGRIVEPSAGRILLTLSNQDAAAAPQIQETEAMPEPQPAVPSEQHSAECCADAFTATGSSDALGAFRSFLAAVGKGGSIDARTKQLITFALVVMARCRPCIRAHAQKAAGMGISRQQLDEAAWCAVAMGGAPVKLFYEEAMNQSGQGQSCCS